MRKYHKAIAFLCLMLSALDLFARAGGGGGNGGSGGGGGGGGDLGLLYMAYYLLRFIFMLPFPINVIVIVGIIVVAVLILRKRKSLTTGFNQVAPKTYSLQPDQDLAQKMEEMSIDGPALKAKAGKAFMAIQDAWMKQNLSGVRRYISDGVYQRFHTQFRMMKMLEQENLLENIVVHSLNIVRVETDGPYQVAHIKIHAVMVDTYRSKKYSNIQAKYHDNFVEFWSFARLKSHTENDLYAHENCPKCGGSLPEEAGEVSRCGHCGTLTNSGAFDWVLAEITQADDFVINFNNPARLETIPAKAASVTHPDKNFSVQMLEDKASNGFLQIYTSLVTRDEKSVRRFVTDEVFEKIKDRVKREIPFIYHRFYLNDVSLTDACNYDGRDIMTVKVKFTFQKIKADNERAIFIDHAPITRSDIIQLERKHNPPPAGGELYAHSCPHCGGPLPDTLDIVCAYCGTEVNNGAYEWIISAWEDAAVFKQQSQQKQETETADLLDKAEGNLLRTRDYALNNILVMVASDGNINEQEKQFLQKIQKQWGLTPSKMENMVLMANSKRLSLRMPEDAEARQKVISMMEKAANADGNVNEAEKLVLDSVKNV